MVSRVRNEVEIHSRLKHPSVLELYNYFEDANYVYLILEMCHNREINRYLKTTQKRLTENEGIIIGGRGGYVVIAYQENLLMWSNSFP